MVGIQRQVSYSQEQGLNQGIRPFLSLPFSLSPATPNSLTIWYLIFSDLYLFYWFPFHDCFSLLLFADKHPIGLTNSPSQTYNKEENNSWVSALNFWKSGVLSLGQGLIPSWRDYRGSERETRSSSCLVRCEGKFFVDIFRSAGGK